MKIGKTFLFLGFLAFFSIIWNWLDWNMSTINGVANLNKPFHDIYMQLKFIIFILLFGFGGLLNILEKNSKALVEQPKKKNVEE